MSSEIDIGEFPSEEGWVIMHHMDSFGMRGIDYTDAEMYLSGTDKVLDEKRWYVDGRARHTLTKYHEDGTFDRTIIYGTEQKTGNGHRIIEESREEEHGVWKSKSNIQDV